MLYLKNSLVILTLIFFSLFFLTTLSADDGNFILPKKKIITIKPTIKKANKTEVNKSYKSINLPQKNPLRQKAGVKTKQKDSKIVLKFTKKKKFKKKYLIIIFH